MGNQGSKSEPEETTSVKNKKTTTAKKQKTSKNFNSFVNESTEVTSTETVFNEIYSTIEATQSPTPTPTSVKPGLIPTSTKSKSPTATSTSGSSSRGKGSNGSTNWKLYGGIALAVILVIIILALIVKKMNKKSKKDEPIQNYQTLKPQPPKSSGSAMFSGPIYDPSKENQYVTMNYNNNSTSMGVATSVDAATLQRQQNQELEASAYTTGTLPNYNSPQKQQSLPVSSMPQTSMPQSYSYSQNGQAYGQSYDLNNVGSYDQYNQTQQTYNNGYNQYGQQPSYDNVNTGYNNMSTNPYGVQYPNNYTPSVSAVDQTAISSPLSLPVSTAGGVIVSATYASSQTTSVKQADGTITETVDYTSSNSYEVDKDYIAMYSYEPNMTDELTISVNDRIHLLEMYSDGWGYGKNVTTGQIGILPLNRLKIDETKNKDDPVEEMKKNNKSFNDISKRTVSMNKRPKNAEAFDETKKTIDERKKSDRKKRYSDEDDYDRRRYSDDDDYERRRDRRRYDDDDDYERRRDRRRYDDDDYERRRDRRRYDDDDYERRRDRRRYSDDDDYERRRDRRRYDDDDDYERRRDRKRYDDDYEKKDRSEKSYERKKSYREDSTERKTDENSESKKDNTTENKSNEDKESKKSDNEETRDVDEVKNENKKTDDNEESKKSNDNGIVEYELKTYRSNDN